MKKSDQYNESQLLLYQTEDGRQRIEVHLENETVWLSQKPTFEFICVYLLGVVILHLFILLRANDAPA
jgi:hypothetical protein